MLSPLTSDIPHSQHELLPVILLAPSSVLGRRLDPDSHGSIRHANHLSTLASYPKPRSRLGRMLADAYLG